MKTHSKSPTGYSITQQQRDTQSTLNKKKNPISSPSLLPFSNKTPRNVLANMSSTQNIFPIKSLVTNPNSNISIPISMSSSMVLLPALTKNAYQMQSTKSKQYLQLENVGELSPSVQHSFEQQQQKKQLKKQQSSLQRWTTSKFFTTSTRLNSLQAPPLFKTQFHFIVEKGNNSELVKEILLRREWWTEAVGLNDTINFKWKPSSKGVAFSNLSFTPSKKQMVNHIEDHSELSSKSKLFLNLKANSKKNIDDLVPTTYLVNVDSDTYQKDLEVFLEEFLRIEGLNNVNIKIDKQSEQQQESQRNIWIYKPDELNRGQGISLFNSISTLFCKVVKLGRVDETLAAFEKVAPKLVQKYSKWRDRHAKSDSDRHIKANPENTITGTTVAQGQGAAKQQLQTGEMARHSSCQDMKESKSQNIRRLRVQLSNLTCVPKVVVLQKYIERPLLLTGGRKFDIRVWVLLDSNFTFHVFKEGYIRLSSEAFSIRSRHLNDIYVHLTNNAIQKEGANYGKYESGNIISYADYDRILESKECPFRAADTISQIKELVRTSFRSVSKKLLKKNRNNTFEIFGYDFLVAENGHTYLIEVNSNPCIEESNSLLQKLVPRMLNDAFRLTLDTVFSSLKSQDCGLNDYPVEGYTNFENLWESIGDLQTCGGRPKVQYQGKDSDSTPTSQEPYII